MRLLKLLRVKHLSQVAVEKRTHQSARGGPSIFDSSCWLTCTSGRRRWMLLNILSCSGGCVLHSRPMACKTGANDTVQKWPYHKDTSLQKIESYQIY